MIPGKTVTVLLLGQLLPVTLSSEEFLHIRILKCKGGEEPKLVLEGPMEAFSPTEPAMRIVKCVDEKTGKVIF